MSVKLDHGGDDLVETHEINVTPFIDVMLVLLIIFMVAAPLATVSVPVDLPTSTAAPAPKPDKPVIVTVTADLSLSVGDAPVDRAGLGAALAAGTGGDKETRILLRIDKEVAYGAMMEVMDALRDAGYTKVGLVGRERP